MTESFNGQIDELRCLLVLNFHKMIRKKIMKAFRRRQQQVQTWPTTLPPRVLMKVNKAQTQGKIYKSYRIVRMNLKSLMMLQQRLRL